MKAFASRAEDMKSHPTTLLKADGIVERCMHTVKELNSIGCEALEHRLAYRIPGGHFVSTWLSRQAASVHNRHPTGMHTRLP